MKITTIRRDGDYQEVETIPIPEDVHTIRLVSKNKEIIIDLEKDKTSTADSRKEDLIINE